MNNIISFINSRFSNKMRNLKAYTALSIPFILVFVLLRLYDFINVYSHSESLMSFGELIKSLGMDFMLAMGFSGLGFIVFMLLSVFSFRLSKVVFYIVFSLIIGLYIGFLQYFNNVLVPLDQVVFIYDYNDIVNIAMGSGTVGIMEILVFVISLLSYFLASYFLSKISISSYLSAFYAFLIIGAGASTNVYIVSQVQFPDELSYYCNANKFVYFVKAVADYSKSEKDIDVLEISKYTIQYRKLDRSAKKYGSALYPFYYNNDFESTLSKYFNPLPEGEKPNIVMIIVESLSTTVSGKYTINYSFTPFIDSLAEHSLYWRNCFSTAERTFGVLPALLASLPPGKEGFTELEQPYPTFKSFPNMLKNNGYATHQFYGGWPGFTHMDDFVNAAGIDSIYYDFPDYEKMPRSASGHTWGYGDNVLFKAAEPFINSDTAYFDLYLTLSTHSPFATTEPELLKSYTDSMIQSVENDELRLALLKRSEKLKSFVVLDNELRLFFKRYKKRPEYNKTIFIITGDHNGVIFKGKNSIGKYSVPLIIYSPLLNTHQEFGGVVTHNDVSPSLQNLLYNKYNLKSSATAHSIGVQLDTSVAFHANNRYFPMRNSRELNEYIYGKYYLNEDLLYELHDTMEIELIDDEPLKRKMQKELEEYRKLQNHVVNSNILISPMDLYLGEDK